MKLESIRTINLRAIQDSGTIELKPITILVGKNSSGKSTFARTLPLLRQSAEAAKKGPILWWGRLVDYGSFEEALNRTSEKKEIGLEFRMSFSPKDLAAPTRRAFGRLSMTHVLQDGTFATTLTFKTGTEGAYTSKICIEIFDVTCSIDLDEHGFASKIATKNFEWKSTDQILCYGPQDRLIPRIGFLKKTAKEKKYTYETTEPLHSELIKTIRSATHGNTTDEKIRQLADKIPLGPRKKVYEYLSALAEPRSFRSTLNYQGQQSAWFSRLYEIAFVRQIDLLLETINNGLSSAFNDVIYLEPLRATAQRYYRAQSLSVAEIDSKGENIAMFLDSLKHTQKLSFAQWTKTHFGIEVLTKNTGGHISLKIKNSASETETNIADMGFGFSQVLPIAAQLWAASVIQSSAIPGKNKSLHPIVVIEQPELHLHPDFQSNIADVFAAAIKRTDIDDIPRRNQSIRIIAETHSPALINRIGELIANKELRKQDVQVLLFEQEEPNSPARVCVSDFDDEGILRNWPIGFFEPTRGD